VGREIVALEPDLSTLLDRAAEAGFDAPFVGALGDPSLEDAAFIGVH
jgi:hypothetical protein